MKYLGLIDAIALLHQHQREVKRGVVRGRKVDYIEATLDDIAVVNRLANEALGRTLDELPPQTRRLLFLIEKMVRSMEETEDGNRQRALFTRRQVREHTGWGNTQLKMHLRRLEDMEYVVVHRAGRSQSYLYELVYSGEGKDGSPFVLGLLSGERLQRGEGSNRYDGEWSGSEPGRSGQDADRSAPGRPVAGGWSGGGRSGEKPATTGVIDDSGREKPRNAHQGTTKRPGSYSHGDRTVMPMSAAARSE
jgi:hypothetical protein